MFRNHWKIYVISKCVLESLAKYTTMHTHMSQKQIHISKPVQVISAWIIYPELVLVRPYMLSNEILPINPKNLVPPKNSLVLMWWCSMTLLLNKIRTNDELVLFSKKQSMEDKMNIQQ